MWLYVLPEEGDGYAFTGARDVGMAREVLARCRVLSSWEHEGVKARAVEAPPGIIRDLEAILKSREQSR